jgi:hypothetical protein
MVDDLQDKLGEDFESSLQELDKLSKDSSVPAEDNYNSDDCFTINQAPYQELLTMARPLAKQIVRELKLQAPNTNTAPDKSVGRFKMRYYIRNNEIPFARRKTEGRDVPPIAISLIIDRSGSMICSAVALKVTAMAIVSACEQLRIPLDIRIFTGNNHIKAFDEWGPQIYSRIAGTKVLGGTFLLPSLVSSAKDLKDRPEPLKQTILIHDGTPDDHSSVVEWLNYKSNPDIFAMYLLPNNISAEESECRTTKGTLYMATLFDPRNFVVMEADKALAYWCSYMKTYRNHFSKVR